MTATASLSAKAVIARQLEVINRHDYDTFAAAYSPDALVRDPWYSEPLKGAEALARDFADFFTAFPDLRFSAVRLLEDGDVYGAEFTLTGTHKGPLATPTGRIPATGKRIDVPGAVFGRIDAEGRIVEERRQYDVAAMMTQLGLMQ